MAGSTNVPILFQLREADAIVRIGRNTSVVNVCEFVARISISIGAICRIGL